MAKDTWLLWDGECGFCHAMASRLVRLDRDQRLITCSYQNCPRPPMTDEIWEMCKTQMVIVTPEGKVLGGADGYYYVRKQEGSPLAGLMQIPPMIWVARLGYALVARNRSLISRVFYGKAACGLGLRYPELSGTSEAPKSDS
jgi:predicted DCC family thiol-disulfide oxidoreductase YuxK